MPDLLGQLVKNRYRLEREIGRGGFGAVYFARDTQLLDKPVVVKILVELTDEWFRKKFAQEMEALTRINHPGVITVLDSGELDTGQPFLVMPYLEGATLRKRMQEGPLSLDAVASITRQVGHALEAAHACGVLHRDLKPENIFLHPLDDRGEQFHATLIDFGIARVSESAVAPEGPTRLAGSFAYMSPEQLDGKPLPASDTYSLGVIAYEMLTGRVPFPSDSLFQFVREQRAGVREKPRALRPEISDAAEKWILSALATETGDRPASPREFADAFGRALVPPDAEPSPIPGPPKPRWSWWWAAALIPLVILGVWMLRPRTVSAPSQEPARLTYWITVQKFRNGLPYQEPFTLAREVVFESDYRIRIHVRAVSDGHLYILNQGPESNAGIPQFASLFPTPTSNRGDSLIWPAVLVNIPEESSFAFDQQRGVESIWLVFSSKPVAELTGFAPGLIHNPETVLRIQDFLRAQVGNRAATDLDEEMGRTILRGARNPIVHQIKLIHQ